MDPTLGSGHYKYAEFQYICSPEHILSKNCFGDIDHIELFDLAADPYEQPPFIARLVGARSLISRLVCRFELHNVYNISGLALRTELARRLRRWYPCAGVGCP